METISETWLRNASADDTKLRCDAFFNELQQLMTESADWPVHSQHTSSDGTCTTVRRKPHGRSPWLLQRSSTMSSVSYTDLRRILFTNHSLQEPKYIELMQDARELLVLPVPMVNEAGIYQLNYKATLASGREFVELVTTREITLGDDGQQEQNPADGIEAKQQQQQPKRRAFMVVSKPVSDTTEPVRPGFVRGKYEAWERVEELDNGQVKWTCIQRSDPGGWVPKCIADRVTAKELPKDVSSVIAYCQHTRQ